MAKLKIAIGDIDLEYDGANEFSAAEIRDLIADIRQLSASKNTKPQTDPVQNSQLQATQNAEDVSLHITSIAARLKCQTGPDLAIAAAAYLQLNKGQTKFSRGDLIAAMKEDTGHYKQSMSKNLTSILNSLVSSKILNQIDANNYSLSITEQERVRSEIG